MKHLFSINYWFASNPGTMSKSLLYGMIIIGAVFLFAYLLLVIFKKNIKEAYLKKIYNRLSSFCITNFVITLFLFFFGYEEIPFLSSRFWYLVWIISLIVWLAFIVKSLTKLPEIKLERIKEQEYKKYIP